MQLADFQTSQEQQFSKTNKQVSAQSQSLQQVSEYVESLREVIEQLDSKVNSQQPATNASNGEVRRLEEKVESSVKLLDSKIVQAAQHQKCLDTLQELTTRVAEIDSQLVKVVERTES